MHDHGRHRLTLDGVAHHVHGHGIDGRRIRELGGLEPPEDFVLVLLLRRGSQSVGLDQEVHLGDDEVATLLSFRSDRLWTFTLDGHGTSGAPTASPRPTSAVTPMCRTTTKY